MPPPPAKPAAKAAEPPPPEAPKKAPLVQTVEVGQIIWVPAPTKDHPDIFQEATILAVDEFSCTARTIADSRLETLDLTKDPIYLANKSVQADMTGLHYIHEPGIMYNLQQRAFQTEPYTFMGSVLVAVNPFRRVPNPTNVGTRSVMMGPPHPYNVAEASFQQMTFQGSRELLGLEKGIPGSSLSKASQSIVVGGESGAGKTEGSKMVLQHLVTRQTLKGGAHGNVGGLDSRLLGTNPILEAFGNASTLRNPNSSRFGKMLRLHYDPPATSQGGENEWNLKGASVQSYLLERSRVTTHEEGERGYHVFYFLIAGARCGEATMQGLGLEKGAKSFRLTMPPHPKYDDKFDDGFCKELADAMTAVGFTHDQQIGAWKVTAALLHLGNLEFGEKDTSDGATAFVSNQDVLKLAASLLGVEPEPLEKIFTVRKFEVAGKMMMTVRNARAAFFARDAVVKGVYSGLFDWVLKQIDIALGGAGGNPIRTSTIGVLDIFGFETFAVNGFEQLLINYTNEALQGTFNSQIFIAEAALYEREGLVGSNSSVGEPLDNGVCIELLQGVDKTPGLLMTIDSEGRVPDPNDKKMLVTLHKNFEKHECMIKPHPKDKASVFILKHYAATVTYTVGTFLEKNQDRLPDDMESTLKASTLSTMQEIFQIQNDAAASAAPPANAGPPLKPGQKPPPARKPPAKSIVHKFQGQIKQLVDDLESTKCSFIRCVKPNFKIHRVDGDDSWYSRQYVKKQLDALNIAQTAEVLRNGFPTRIEYSVLVETYVTVLPPNALNSFNKSSVPGGGKDNKSFVRALFYMFEVDPEAYKLGLTRVFFKGGKLAELDKIMKAANSGAITPELIKRFTYFYARVKWRRAAVLSRCQLRLEQLFERARKRIRTAITIQSLTRMQTHRQYFVALKRGAAMVQKIQRGRIARKAYKVLYAARIEDIRRMQEEALAAAKAALEAARLAGEEAAIREAEARAREEREKQERQEREAEEKAAREAEAALRIEMALEQQAMMEQEQEDIFQNRRRMSMMPRNTAVMRDGGKLGLRGGRGMRLKRGGPPPLPPPPPIFDDDEPPPPPDDDDEPPPPPEDDPADKRKMSFFKGIAAQQEEEFKIETKGTFFLRSEEKAKGLAKMVKSKKYVYEKVAFSLDKPNRKLTLVEDSNKKNVHEIHISTTAKIVRNKEDKNKPNGAEIQDPGNAKFATVYIAFENEGGFRRFAKHFDEAVAGFKSSVPELDKSKKAQVVDLKIVAQLNLLLYRKQITQKEFDDLFAKAQEDAANPKKTAEEEHKQSGMDGLGKLDELKNPMVKNIPFMKGRLTVASGGMVRQIDPSTFEEIFMLSFQLRFFLNKLPDKQVGWEMSHKFTEFEALAKLLQDPTYYLTPEARLAVPEFPTLNYGSYAKRINREHNEGLCKQVEEWCKKFWAAIPHNPEQEDGEEEEEKDEGEDEDEFEPEKNPKNWRTVRDPETGEIYWNNKVTGATVYEDPFEGMDIQIESDLPEGWEEILDPGTGEAYYYNVQTEETTWEKPKKEEKIVIKKYGISELLHVEAVSDFFGLKGNVQAMADAAENAVQSE